MTLTYYDEIVGTIRPSIKEDCAAIAFDMRIQDEMEMWSFDRSSPIEAVRNSFNKSIISMTIEHDGTPVAMFGILPRDMSSGVLWMFGTDRLKVIGRPFVRNCKKWFNDMLEIYPILEGYVDLRNNESIRWLTYIEAVWGDTEIMGIDKMPFRKFTFSNIKPVVISREIIRKEIDNLEAKIKQIPGHGENDCLPLKHKFAEGMYVREIFIPKGMLVVGKIHKKSNPVFVMKGDISIFSEEGSRRFKGGEYVISQPGAKRVGYTHEDTTWVEVFATHETDLEKLEEELIVKSYNELTHDEQHFIYEVSKCAS